MPIRMVDDPNDNYSNENENTGRGGGGIGGGGFIQFIPMILGLLIRKPILLLVIAVIGGFMYFQNGCNSSNNLLQLATGGILDPQEYKKASVYEALDESKNNLPEQISLLRFAFITLIPSSFNFIASLM